MLRFISSVLVTLWAGSLWTVCLIAAPSAFAVLPERHLAGLVVGRLFLIETWLGLAAAVSLIAVLTARGIVPEQKSVLWIILVTAAAPLISHLVLTPMMNQARAADDMARFGQLHGVSAVLFLIACVSALALVWQLSRQAK